MYSCIMCCQMVDIATEKGYHCLQFTVKNRTFFIAKGFNTDTVLYHIPYKIQKVHSLSLSILQICPSVRCRII